MFFFQFLLLTINDCVNDFNQSMISQSVIQSMIQTKIVKLTKIIKYKKKREKENTYSTNCKFIFDIAFYLHVLVYNLAHW